MEHRHTERRTPRPPAALPFFPTTRLLTKQVYNRWHFQRLPNEKAGPINMNWQKLFVGAFTALAMMGLSFLLPKGTALGNASLAQFPTTVGVWAIFVLLFVKLK